MLCRKRRKKSELIKLPRKLCELVNKNVKLPDKLYKSKPFCQSKCRLNSRRETSSCQTSHNSRFSNDGSVMNRNTRRSRGRHAGSRQRLDGPVSRSDWMFGEKQMDVIGREGLGTERTFVTKTKMWQAMDGCVRGRIYDLVQHLGLQRLQNFKDFGVYLFFPLMGIC